MNPVAPNQAIHERRGSAGCFLRACIRSMTRSVGLAAGRDRLCGSYWRGLGNVWAYRARDLNRSAIKEEDA